MDWLTWPVAIVIAAGMLSSAIMFFAWMMYRMVRLEEACDRREVARLNVAVCRRTDGKM